MITAIKPVNDANFGEVLNAVSEVFNEGELSFCGDTILISFDETKEGTLYAVWSKLDFIEFMLAMDKGIDLEFSNGPAVLAGLLETVEMEKVCAYEPEYAY